MKWILTCLFFLLSCATPVPEIVPIHQPSTSRTACTPAAVLKNEELLTAWTEDFFRDAEKYRATCHKVRSIQFLPQSEIPEKAKAGDGFVIGYCTGDGHIRLSRDIWETRSLLFNKALLYHELGHCSLGLDHAPEGKVNLMTPYLLEDSVLEEHWAELVEKLFTGSMQLVEGDSDVVLDRPFMP